MHSTGLPCLLASRRSSDLEFGTGTGLRFQLPFCPRLAFFRAFVVFYLGPREEDLASRERHRSHPGLSPRRHGASRPHRRNRPPPPPPRVRGRDTLDPRRGRGQRDRRLARRGRPSPVRPHRRRRLRGRPTVAARRMLHLEANDLQIGQLVQASKNG